MSTSHAIDAVRELFLHLQPRSVALEFADLTLHPLDLELPDGPRVLHVREALERGFVHIEELDSPSVPTVTVINKGELPVFFPAGAVLKGGAQTRIVATPTIVLAGVQARVAVRCVEAGRWTTHADRKFQAVAASPLRMKRSKMRRDGKARMSSGQRAADQGETWQEVSSFLVFRNLSSRTSSLADGMAAESRRAQDERQRLSPSQRASVRQALHGARGLAVARKSASWISWDLFGNQHLSEHGVRMAVESVELETGRTGRVSDEGPGTAKDTIRQVLGELDTARWTLHNEGAGTLVDFATQSGAHGTALVYEGSVLQATLTFDDDDA